MREMQNVIWSKGLLLTPQHLQVQDRFLESLFAFRLSAVSPWSWGFSSLSLDREALEGGSFALTSASGLMPDGLPFDMPDSEPVPPPRPLAEQWDPDLSEQTVRIAVPEERLGGQNVSDSGGTRYRSEIVMRKDETTGRSEKPIQIARKNIRFLFEEESLEGYVSMPIAVVRRSTSGFSFDPRFIPPLLDISASPNLQGVVRRTVGLLIARSTALAALRRRRSKGVASFGVSDVANFWLLYTLNESLPAVRHFLEPGGGHPQRLYETLQSLAGSLTTFSSEIDPGDLPDYDHMALRNTFGPLEQAIDDLLRSVVPDRFASVPLVEGERSVYTGQLDDTHISRGERFFIAFHAEGLTPDGAADVPDRLKVGSRDRVEELVSFARPGLRLTHVTRLPPAIPIKSDFEYFEVDRSRDEWAPVRESRTFSVYVSSEFRDPSLELVILLPEAD